MPACSVQGVDQFDLFLIYGGKAGIQVHDAAEDRHRHACCDDRRRGGAEPHDEQRRKCGFRQAVQDDEVGFQYLGQFPAAPQKDSDENTAQRYQKKTDDRLIQRNSDMQEDRAVHYHFPKAQGDLRRTAEDKGVDDSRISTDFP